MWRRREETGAKPNKRPFQGRLIMAKNIHSDKKCGKSMAPKKTMAKSRVTKS